MQDFYNKANTWHEKVLENAKRQNEANSELLMVNFGLRSKVFINKVNSQPVLERKEIVDKLFEKLFETNYEELSGADSMPTSQTDMSVYTAWFLKILIKTLQSSNQCFNALLIMKLFRALITNEKLVVATNSLPMFLVV